ncbi:MAG: hypothetical protein HYU36_02890 [Planctomycetes bacterium]|nr:hypothetical protein [Planctomycetota bacterium]
MSDRRFHYWVDHEIQWPFTVTILIVMGFSAVAGAIMAFCVSVLAAATEEGIWPLGYLPPGAANTLAIALLMLAFMTLMVIYGILASHKIAGPLVAVRRTLRRIREGDFSRPITIRRDDWIHDLVDDLNETFAVLKERNALLEQRIRQFSETGYPGAETPETSRITASTNADVKQGA